MIGRERELARLEELVDGVRERGATLLVRGAPGIGKSTLVTAANRRAKAAGMQVIRTTGVQSEARLPFAGLHQLVLPVLDHSERLPAPQKKALLAAFGIIEDTAPDRFLIALAVLELLSDAAEQSPLLVVVDDAQWLDRSTVEVLAFVARRVEHEPIGVLVAIREGVESVFDEAGLPQLRLGGLDDAAAEALLEAHAPHLAPAVRERLRDEASGNPLALVELPVPLGPKELDGRSPLPAPLPLTERLEQTFAARTVGLPEITRTVLLVAALNDSASLSETLEAASGLVGREVTVEVMAPAVSTRLLDSDGSGMRFRHPLVRTAIRQAATPSERQAAHAALAATLTGQPDRSVWHRAASLLGPDREISAELEATATRARRRGAIDAAIAALERGAGLSVDPLARGRRLLDAAELAFEMGRTGIALGFVGEAEPLALDTVDRQRAILIRESFDFGVPGDSVNVDRVLEIVEQTRHRDPDLALNLLRRAAAKSWALGRSKDQRELLAAEARRMDAPDGDPQRLAVLAMVGTSADTERVLGLLSRPASGWGDPISAHALGHAGYAVGDFEFAVDALTAAIPGLRAQGRLSLLAQALVSRAMVALQLGRLDLAVPDAEEGLRLATKSGLPLFAASARATSALLAGLRGDFDEAEALTAEAERALLPLRARAVFRDVQLARGIAAMGIGRYEDAYGHLIRMFDPNDPAEHYRKKFWAVGDLAEAALHSGRQADALAVLKQAEAVADPKPSPCLRISLEYARAMLAEDGAAEALFEAALGADLTRWPFARARLQLAYGTWLRRQRRVIESREPLRLARDAFEALGMPPWTERACHELRSAGVVTPKSVARALQELTPQELQIARMAASGLSNREIGQQLYLSHRTVGAHLYRAFPKLGITSRGQLRNALDALS
ncbi:ATP-binding protein [Rubrobacter tropicus]|uniref:ATP-binding protein n=1 Tax=Rubrobacter tropicus TaxID=2653851 RepID=UPI001A9E35DF|nr:AAA family ATPase [Rubrobacter tropicus]